jgi:hypothetical protein
MSGANDNEIRFTTAQIVFNLRDPVAVPDIDETPAERWKIAKRFMDHACEAIGVAASPGPDHAAALRLSLSGIDE